jgi:hypothetical protein
MQGVSAAASIIAVIHISARVIGLCRKYYLEVRDAKMDIQRLHDEMMPLKTVLTKVMPDRFDNTSCEVEPRTRKGHNAANDGVSTTG